MTAPSTPSRTHFVSMTSICFGQWHWHSGTRSQSPRAPCAATVQYLLHALPGFLLFERSGLHTQSRLHCSCAIAPLWLCCSWPCRAFCMHANLCMPTAFHAFRGLPSPQHCLHPLPPPAGAVEHCEVLSVRLVRLQGAWAGPEGEEALYEGALQIKVGCFTALADGRGVPAAKATVSVSRLAWPPPWAPCPR